MKSLVLVAVLSGTAAVALVLSHRPAGTEAAAPRLRAVPAAWPIVRPAQAELPSDTLPMPAVEPREAPPPPPVIDLPVANVRQGKSEEKADGVMVGPDGVIYQRAER